MNYKNGKSICILLLLFLQTYWVFSQDETQPENLIFNPSFEDYLFCPKKIESLGILTCVIGWWQPSAGSSDYFNKCSRECGIPENKLGIQKARTGNAFCGFYASKTEYREYLETELKSRLKAGERYRLTFYVSLSEYSTGAVATIGGLFTKERIKQNDNQILIYSEEKSMGNKVKQTIAKSYVPQVVNNYNNPLLNTIEWEKISGEFVAEGGEKYLTIGNFFPLEQSNYKEPPYLTYLLPGSYYYIDDVEVICLTCSTSKPDLLVGQENKTPAEDPDKFPPGELEIGKTFVLENIFFQFDKSALLPESFIELERLMKLLRDNPDMRIEILGHTDDKGGVDYNLKLSNERARSVVDYLVKRGITSNRLRFKGYGKSSPIATNSTEEGRAKNRRVEFKILDM